MLKERKDTNTDHAIQDKCIQDEHLQDTNFQNGKVSGSSCIEHNVLNKNETNCNDTLKNIDANIKWNVPEDNNKCVSSRDEGSDHSEDDGSTEISVDEGHNDCEIISHHQMRNPHLKGDNCPNGIKLKVQIDKQKPELIHLCNLGHDFPKEVREHQDSKRGLVSKSKHWKEPTTEGVNC